MNGLPPAQIDFNEYAVENGFAARSFRAAEIDHITRPRMIDADERGFWLAAAANQRRRQDCRRIRRSPIADPFGCPS